MMLRLPVKCLILTLVSMIALLGTQPQAQAQSEPIACGETVRGEITDAKLQDYWWFAGQAGQTVTISMWGELDSALLLADTGGYVLARSSGIGDAYLEQTIETTATYTIEATRRGGESGDSAGAYQLLLNCAAQVSQAGATVNTATELAAAIRAANHDAEADVISLGADITLTAELPTISSSITILGNEHSISGNEQVRIFFVTESGALTLRDAILRDGATREGGSLCLDFFEIDTDEAAAPGFGGAICNIGSLEVSGSVFSGNSAVDGGGAIANLGEASISDSDFSGNAAEGGGAILNLDIIRMFSISDIPTEEVGDAIVNFGAGSISISGSVFSGNSAVDGGGAIANLGEASISDSDFRNNSAGEGVFGGRGGVIENYGDLSISDSVFSGNSAFSGGAITNYGGGSISISNSDFSGNSANAAGAAGAITNEGGGSISISGSVFSGNSAYAAGAITNEGEISINDSDFRYNFAEYNGGAITNSGEISISNSVFSGNSARTGGAITNSGEISISDSDFSGNSAEEGGAIWNYEDGEVNISDSDFSDNSAVDGGGAIWNDEDGEVSISNSVFSDNSPQDCHGVVCRSVPDGGPSGQVGVAASASDDLASQAGATVSTATELAGAIRVANQNAEADVISLDADITLTRELPTISSSITILGNEHSISGNDQLRIFTITESGALTLRDAILLDGDAKNSDSLCDYADSERIGRFGGAICNLGSLELSDSVFSGNSAHGGGAIANRGELSISASNFSGNFVVDGGFAVNDGFGGAIINYGGGSISISNSEFSDNISNYIGGAIVNFGEVSISNSEFSGNSARYSGGAIDNHGKANISYSEFNGNSADYGGAIWNDEDGEISISDSVFSDNSPQDCHGVVCRSVPDGGPSGQVGVGASESDDSASPSPSRISYGDSATGYLSDSRAYIDFPFQAQTGDNVVISMDATGGYLDPLLKLYDDAGNELANDDDSGYGKNALIEFRIPSTGEFVINAGRYADSGDFRVSLSLAETRAAQVPQAGATISTATELAAAIRAANQNAEADVINLDADITLTAELPTISSKITILGNRHSISGNERVRIFFVEEDGNLRIAHLTLDDGAAHDYACEGNSGKYGGAICNLGSLEVRDSVFSGNYAEVGGAIHNRGKANISYSVFRSNSAQASGAIMNVRGGSFRVNFSIFKDNSAEVRGGAIHNRGEANISYSEFTGNSAGSAEGGAISEWTGASNNINNSVFRNNSAKETGGAIDNWEAEVSINNSVFRNNSAGLEGGAIHHGNNSGITDISYSEFSGNSAKEGGAINDSGFLYRVAENYNWFSGNRPQNCMERITCYSPTDGGPSGQVGVGASAPDELASPPPSRISYGDSATDSLSDSRAYIDFPFQAQAGDDVVISMEATSGDLDPLLKLYDDAGNELANDDDSGDGRNALIEFRIPSTGEFVINAGRYSGSGDFRVNLSLAETRAAQVPQVGATVSTATELAAAIRAANQNAEADVISLDADITLTAGLPRISSSITILGNGHSISGNDQVRIFFVAEDGNLRIEHLTLEDGATDNLCSRSFFYLGGAICNFGSLEVRSSIFSGNSSAESGGAIANFGEANISYSEFNGNSAEEGGAIMNLRGGSFRVNFSIFKDNSVENRGGAIHNNGELSISFSEFNGNSAEEGGAIWNDEDGEAIIIKSVFSDNSPQDCHGVVCRSVPDGGPSGQVGVSASESDDLASQAGATVSTATELAAAIRAANQNAEADVINLGADITLMAEPFTISSSITILGNGHSISGNDQLRIFIITESGALTLRDAILRDGAIREGSSLCLDPDIFEIDTGEVAATGLGGAICNNGSLEVSGSGFIGNSAVGGGGAIINFGEASISGSVFSVNSSVGFGGAIFNLGEASISDSDFSDNSAEEGGGAIANLDLAIYGIISNSDNPTEEGGDAIVNFGEINISGSDFSDNSAEEGGAIVNFGEASISGSVFSGNSADWGGAIANRGELSISGSNFSGNRAYFGSKSFNGGLGGAIINFGEVSISGSVFSGNTSEGFGGAIVNFGEVSISDSEFSGNISNLMGGAIWNDEDGEASISNSEFSGNSSSTGGAIWNKEDGEVSISNSVFSDNSPQNCHGVVCRSVPDGGPSGQVGVSASASDAPAIPGDASGSTPAIVLAHEKLLAVENVACSASDSYFILRLKPDSVLNQHILEINLNTRGDARIAQIVPLPEADSYGEDVKWVDFSELGEAGLQQVSSYLIEAGAELIVGGAEVVVAPVIKVLEYGSDVQRWVDERYTRGQSPAGLRLTWYNTGVVPAVARYLVHVSHSSDGSLALSTSLARLTIFAQVAAAQHNEMKPRYEGDYLAEVLNFFSGKTAANATKDLLKPLIPEELQYLVDFSPAAVMAYFTERVAINRDAMEISQPVAIC